MVHSIELKIFFGRLSRPTRKKNERAELAWPSQVAKRSEWCNKDWSSTNGMTEIRIEPFSSQGKDEQRCCVARRICSKMKFTRNRRIGEKRKARGNRSTFAQQGKLTKEEKSRWKVICKSSVARTAESAKEMSYWERWKKRKSRTTERFCSSIGVNDQVDSDRWKCHTRRRTTNWYSL